MRDAGQDSFIGSWLRRASPDLSRPLFLNAGPWGSQTQHTHVHRGLELGIVIAKSLDYWVDDTHLHLRPSSLSILAHPPAPPGTGVSANAEDTTMGL
jgi:hypothetical protein